MNTEYRNVSYSRVKRMGRFKKLHHRHLLGFALIYAVIIIAMITAVAMV